MVARNKGNMYKQLLEMIQGYGDLGIFEELWFLLV